MTVFDGGEERKMVTGGIGLWSLRWRTVPAGGVERGRFRVELVASGGDICWNGRG